MLNIAKPTYLDKPLPHPELTWQPCLWFPELLRVRAIIDTLWLFTRGYNQAEEKLFHALKASGARNVQMRKLIGGWGYVYRITGPTRRTYKAMRQWKAADWYRKFWICRVDIAYDFWFSDSNAADAFKYEQGTYLRLSRAANNGFWFNNETRYFVDYRGRRAARRSMTLYTAKRNDRRVRLELRLRNGDAVKRNGLCYLFEDPEMLGPGVKCHTTINPRAIAVRHVMVREFNQHWLQRKVRAALARDDIRPCSWPVWRMNLPGRVVSRYERLAHDNPNHKLWSKAMVTVTKPWLHSLLPRRLHTPD